MAMSEKLRQAIAEFQAQQMVLYEKAKIVSDLLEEETDGALSLCLPYVQMQMYHESAVCSAPKALELFKGMDDNGDVVKRWTNENTCFGITVDGKSILMLLDTTALVR